MRPPKSARSRWPSAAASIDLPLPPGPTSASRVGRVASTVLASVATSPLRPFMPRGRGGKIERRASRLTGRAESRRERRYEAALRPEPDRRVAAAALVAQEDDKKHRRRHEAERCDP